MGHKEQTPGSAFLLGFISALVSLIWIWGWFQISSRWSPGNFLAWFFRKFDVWLGWGCGLRSWAKPVLRGTFLGELLPTNPRCREEASSLLSIWLVASENKSSCSASQIRIMEKRALSTVGFREEEKEAIKDWARRVRAKRNRSFFQNFSYKYIDFDQGNKNSWSKKST